MRFIQKKGVKNKRWLWKGIFANWIRVKLKFKTLIRGKKHKNLPQKISPFLTIP